ncbi:MAG TPA: ATP-binding protein [Gaiellaceae bacterium]|nr:ATP-binding protein [Gaiellaceae bacterium]
MTRLRSSLTAKLLAAQLLVIVAGAATLALVALAVAPGLYHRHVRAALGVVPDDVAGHLDEAFLAATVVALALAVAAAIVAAALVSAFLAVRIVRPVRALAESARRIARGARGVRVPLTGADELGVLARAFNDMAASLDASEQRRRELLSDLAHELRTPLATIDGYLEGMADGVVPASAETWEILGTETRRLRRLVDDLTALSRAEERQLALDVARVDPAALAESAVAAASPAYAAKGVRLHTEVGGPLPEIEVDRDRMAEVLANLLGNALRHTPAGGRVTVSASPAGDGVEIAVTDTGEGIAPEHLQRVFGRFYRADPARARSAGGSGIGLTIARAIVEAHDGRIRAESRGEGAGASFVVTLPGNRIG